MTEKEVYLLRHGDTGKPGCYVGSTDVSLSAIGRQQVKNVAKTLRLQNFDKVLCSPMLRCRQTCEEMDLQIPFQIEELLKEVDFGRWEGKKFAEIAAQDAEAVVAWNDNPESFRFPDGEALASFYKRVSAIFTMLDKDESRRILLVTHGGIIRHLLCLFLGISQEKYLAFDVQPGSYTSLRIYSGGGVLIGMNIRS